MVHVKIKVTSIIEDGNGFIGEIQGKPSFGFNPSIAISIDDSKGKINFKEGDILDLYYKEDTIMIKKVNTILLDKL